MKHEILKVHTWGNLGACSPRKFFILKNIKIWICFNHNIVWQLLHRRPALCLNISTPLTFCAFSKSSLLASSIQCNTITLFKEGSAITYYSFLTYGPQNLLQTPPPLGCNKRLVPNILLKGWVEHETKNELCLMSNSSLDCKPAQNSNRKLKSSLSLYSSHPFKIL